MNRLWFEFGSIISKDGRSQCLPLLQKKKSRHLFSFIHLSTRLTFFTTAMHCSHWVEHSITTLSIFSEEQILKNILVSVWIIFLHLYLLKCWIEKNKNFFLKSFCNLSRSLGILFPDSLTSYAHLVSILSIFHSSHSLINKNRKSTEQYQNRLLMNSSHYILLLQLAASNYPPRTVFQPFTHH